MIIICTLLYRCTPVSKDGPIVIENRNFSYVIDKNGKNLHFTDKTSGTDYLDSDSLSWCALLISDGKKFNVSSVSLEGNHLNLDFSNAGVKVQLRIRKAEDGIEFEVIKVKGPAESLTFINIPLTLEGMPYEPFAACVLSMNLYTRVRELPALQSNLWATCYQRFGMAGSKATMLGVPQKQILAVIRDVMEHAKDVPHSDKGGAWAQLQKEGYGSYLMNFGTLTEETTDEWVRMCRSLGFNQIDNHGGGADFFRFGDFVLNSQKWPEGWESFKRINARLHENGISSIFHTYAFFIDKDSKYVTPVPNEDLGFFSSFTLAEPLGNDDSVIVVNEPTSNISTTTGFFVRNSLSLRINGELIVFKGVTTSPPYQFTGCRRGVNGTSASSHKKNEGVFHLREMFGRFVPGAETPLFEEIAANTAKIVSDCNFDGIYFDAIDGSDILAGEEYFWYYGTKFIFEVGKRLKKPVGMEMSSMSHLWWHYRSRWQAWDRPVRGYKKFEDIHSAAIKSGRLFLPAAIKSNEYEHGLWRGHTPLINKYAGVENGGLLLPLHFGWWGNQTWNPPQIEPTFPDDIEYLCCKMIGNNAGLSMLGGVDEKTLDENPLFRRLIAIIRQYEELRHMNYFNDTIRAALRQPGKEFTLFRNADSLWNFKPIAFQKHKVVGLNHRTSVWTINNEFDNQPVKLRIEPLMSVSQYNDPSNVLLTDFSPATDFKYSGASAGISAEILPAAEKPDGITASASLNANTVESAPGEGLWMKMEKKFDPWLDLSNNQALGVWVKGDGKGQLLNLRIESPKHLSHGARGDHFIRIDFTGWRYFELVEIESAEFSNYIWPDSGFYVYDSYRHSVQFNTVDKLQLWYNNLPAGQNISCLISPIKALAMIPKEISNPSVTIGGEKLTFLIKMEPGMYLEFSSENDCKLFGPKGEFLKDVQTEGKIPELKKGENKIAFTCKSTGRENPRVQVTVISEGIPLGSNKKLN
jgi:hypothetical protein